MRVEERWKDKEGRFLPEGQVADPARDMRVEVVHYDEPEQRFFQNWAELRDAKNQRRVAYLAGHANERILVTIVRNPYESADLTFSEALDHAKKGAAIQRAGWNGKDMFVRAQYPDEHSKMTLPYLYIEYPDGRRCPWLASQTDLMAEDWRIFL